LGGTRQSSMCIVHQFAPIVKKRKRPKSRLPVAKNAYCAQ